MSTWDTEGFESEADLEGRTNPKEGQYHLAIQDVDYESEKAVKGKGLRLIFEILAGTVPGQDGLTFTQTFKWPSAEHKDGGEFVRKLITKLLLATGYKHKSEIGKRMEVEWTDLVGRQIVAKLKAYKRDHEGKHFEGVEIDGLNFWHVDHEDAASVPKDAGALELRPADAAGPEESGQPVGAGVNNGEKDAKQQPTKAAATKKDRFANL